MARDPLVASSLEDLRRGLGLAPRLGAAVVPLARSFARDIVAMDAAIGRGGLAAGADVLLPRYSGRVTIVGAGRVPESGPLVVTANHPGTVDTLCLWRLLAARDDVRIIALDREFLHAVPHLAARLLYVERGHGGRGHAGRAALVRRAADHLRAGGALLTFPAGTIEPDPAVRPADAHAALAGWGRSPELFARLVPDAVVLPVGVSGVISTRMLRHPLARLRRSVADRELAAATLQVVRRDRSITPRVVVGEPLRGAEGLTGRLHDAMLGLL